MALLGLSLVTKSLVKLLEERVGELLKEHFTPSDEWTASTTLTVLPGPPDELEKADGNILGLYLYHISEDGHFKNLPPPGNDQPPVRYTPIGLDLYYQLSAHSDQEGKTGTYREQLMLGLAVKALHDYPVIDESTRVNGVEILPDALKGGNNRFRIVLQPIPYDQATSYWTAGSTPLRLAAYYQVSVILLEPEKPKSRVGRVLAYGVYPFVSGAPRLDGSRNTVSFSIPGETGLREVELRPAQAPPADPSSSPPAKESTVTFTGSNLTGDSTSLLLKSARWKKPVEVGSAWRVVAKTDALTAVVQQKADSEDILPGIYAALAKVVRKRAASDGKTRKFEHLSNETPFVVTPRIGPITKTGNVFTVTGYAFQHGTPPKDLKVQVYVGDRRLKAKSSGNPGPGEFVVTNATTLKLLPPAALASSGLVPLRIFVEGAESLPEWIKV